MRQFIKWMFVLILASCSKENTALGPVGRYDFGIFLAETRDADQSEISLSGLKLEDTSLLSMNDIQCYDWEDHAIYFPESTYENLLTWGNLLHRIFVVVASGKRIYWGKFMDDLDSSGCQNPVIKLMARHPDGRLTTPSTLRIDRAYPTYWGNENDPDLRDNPQIYRALEQGGKLCE